MEQYMYESEANDKILTHHRVIDTACSVFGKYNSVFSDKIQGEQTHKN